MTAVVAHAAQAPSTGWLLRAWASVGRGGSAVRLLMPGQLDRCKDPRPVMTFPPGSFGGPGRNRPCGPGDNHESSGPIGPGMKTLRALSGSERLALTARGRPALAPLARL